MVKKQQQSRAWTYKQRQKHKGREQVQKELKKMREGRTPMNKTNQRTSIRSALAESYEWQLQEERQRAEDYREAWESEKELNKANMEWTKILEARNRRHKAEAFQQGLWMGAALGLGIAASLAIGWGILQ